MLEEIVKARAVELRLQARAIRHRREHEAFARIDRLERALAVARGRLSTLRTLSSRPN